MTYQEIERWPIRCSQCGESDTVPFPPTQGRPVFCRNCWRKKRESNTSQRILEATSIISEDRPFRKVVYDSAWTHPKEDGKA
jgi:CxxC-x17-CxxC domain-containing protein